MLGVHEMPLFSHRRRKESDAKVKSARLQIDLAVLKMTEVLDRVQDQVIQAKEDLGDIRDDQGGGGVR